MTYTIGLSAYYHDSAACILKNSEIVAAAQEERFTRVKHDASFPLRASMYCCKEAGINFSDIDLVGYYEIPKLKLDRLTKTLKTMFPWVLTLFPMRSLNGLAEKVMLEMKSAIFSQMHPFISMSIINLMRCLLIILPLLMIPLF